MSEALTLHEILKAWGKHPRLRIWRTNTGGAQLAGRWVQFNPPGTPDISGIILVGGLGVALGIEVKSPTGRQSKEQKIFESVYRRLGALYVLARSVDDVSAGILEFTTRAGDPCHSI